MFEWNGRELNVKTCQLPHFLQSTSLIKCLNFVDAILSTFPTIR